MSKKLFFVSLGCPKNRVDSEVMLGMAVSSGFSLTEDPEDADVLVVNTCGFIQPAKEESIDTILELAEYKKQQPDKKLIVAGCLPQRYPNELKEGLPEVDLFLGTAEIPLFVKLLEKSNGDKTVVEGKMSWLYNHLSPRYRTTPPHTAYLKIAEGCDRRCAFCAIPLFRGNQTSRKPESILQELQDLARDGVKEVNLVAQELNGYGRDLRKKGETTPDLAQLLQMIEETEPTPPWIRLLYLYPTGFDDRLIETIAQSKKILPYLDIPIQHISDRMLKRMRRGVSSQKIKQLLRDLRQAIPELTLRTTLLVGFPGEREDDFSQLCDFIEEFQFDHLGVFTYSPEEGTPAYSLSDPVPPELAQERKEILYSIQEEISQRRLRERYLNRQVTVLTEGISQESELLVEARLPSQAPEIDGVVYINTTEVPLGEFVTVKIIETHAHDLVAEKE